MAKSKEQKQEMIEKIKKGLEKQKSLFFVNFQGLKAKEIFELREKLKTVNALFYVVKKNLVKLVFEEKKISVGVKDLKGELALVFSFDDEIAPIKIVNDLVEGHKSATILGGIFENEFINQEKAVALAKIPPRTELLARLAGSLQAPMANFSRVLGGNLKGLLQVLALAKT